MTFIDDILQEAEIADEQKRLEMDNLRADHTLMAIRQLEGQLSDVEALYQAELRVLQEYKDGEETRLQRKLNWLSWNLEQFMRGLDLKTFTLPHGVLKLRKGRDKVEIVDLDAFFAAPGHESLIRLIPESLQPDLQAIHEHIRSTGEIPHGTNLIPGETKFSYTTTARRDDDGPQR